MLFGLNISPKGLAYNVPAGYTGTVVEISTVAQLNGAAAAPGITYVNGVQTGTTNIANVRTVMGQAGPYYFVLVDNLDGAAINPDSNPNLFNLNGFATWTPIPLLAAGNVFDGNSKTIDNLRITAAVSPAGFFGNLLGTVKNVTFAHVDIRPTGFGNNTQGVSVGVVAGTVQNGANAVNARLERVYISSGSVAVPALSGGQSTAYVGGLVGWVGAANSNQTGANVCRLDIEFCYTMVNVTSGNYALGTGGFIGHAQRSILNIDTCFNAGGNILPVINNNPNAGGILGRVDTVTLSMNRVYCDANVGWSGSGGGQIGGVIGVITGGTTALDTVVFKGVLSAGTSSIAGIVPGIIPNLTLRDVYYTAEGALDKTNGVEKTGADAIEVDDFIELIMIWFYGYDVWVVTKPVSPDGYTFWSERTSKYAFANEPYTFTVTLADSHNLAPPAVKINGVAADIYESPATGTGVTVRQTGNVWTYTILSLEEDITVTADAIRNTYTINSGPAAGVLPSDYILSGLLGTQTVAHGTVLTFSVELTGAASSELEPFVRAGNNTLSPVNVVGNVYYYSLTATQSLDITIGRIVSGGYLIERPTSGNGWVSQSSDPNSIIAGGTYTFSVQASDYHFGYEGAWRAPVVTILWAGNPVPQTVLGSDETAGLYFYEITNIQANVTIIIAEMPLNTYPVTLPVSGDGYSASSAQGVSVLLPHGTVYNFTVQLQEAYIGNEPLVRVSGARLDSLFSSNPVLGTYNYSFTVTSPADIRISTSEIVYTVNFFINDGTDEMYATQKVPDGDRAVAPVPPQRQGYTFVGWHTEDGAGGWGSQWSASTPVTENTDLYARWGSSPVFITTTLPDGNMGILYSQAITVTSEDSGAIVFSLQSGRLPTGLSLIGNTISGIPVAVNSFTFTIRATNQETGAYADRQFTVTIGKANPPTPGPLAANAGDTLADVGLPNGWTWDMPETTPVGGAGDQEFTASFAGDASYNAVQNVTIILHVGKGIVTAPAPRETVYVVGLHLGMVGLPAGWSWVLPGTGLHADLFAGEGQLFLANFAGDDQYDAAYNILVTVHVHKSNEPPVPGPLYATIGDTLEDVGLPYGWTWDDDPETSVGETGPRRFTASF
ncbi:MAG: InlB B-repeat-containing protein, partial [Clostridiales bacterium]|nr:InlB B-repeat-containing protein [Clostridiales bacterium]